MSYHTGHHSPKSSEGASEHRANISARRSPSQSSFATARNQTSSALSRTIGNLLSTPQSARSAGTGIGGVTLSSRRVTRSPVEPLVSSPLRISSSAMASAPSSPERPNTDAEDPPRRSPDQFDGENDLRASTGHIVGLEEDSKSDVSLTSWEPAVSKKQSRRSMASMMSGLESRLFPKSFVRGRESGGSPARRGSSLDSRSLSSSSRPTRSVSPANHRLQSGSNPTLSSTNKAKAIKMEDAHNKSDETLAKRSGGLPDYVKPTEQGEDGERLAKDVFDRDKNIIESSDEDGDDSSSEDDHTPPGTVQWRGRKKRDSDISTITPSDFDKSRGSKSHPTEEKTTAGQNVSWRDKKPKKSVLKAVVHPQTSFDIPTPRTQSAAGTPYGSEDEADKEDFYRAQKLSISMSNIDNRVPNRSIRTIIRGDFAGLQEEADDGRLRQRKYLVALDLSEESVYALEWAVGAVLRKGDTMFAIYAMNEDNNASSVQVGEGGKAMQDAAAVVGTQTKEASQGYGPGPRNLLGRLGPGTASKSSSVDARASPLAEAERVRAVETISNTCINLLRKTILQVRIAVEVIHCKSPKLMVTEAIDELEPTMVIVGARGQSALKGVLLGSFSNYLLSNSSVPVMVARRKLKRHPSKGSVDKDGSKVRLSNNIPPPKSLMEAKVD